VIEKPVGIVAGPNRVLSIGTFLDSPRFRFHFSKRLNVNAYDVDAQVLGEQRSALERISD
jgi:malate/lactate dehydrogenase